MGSNDRPPGSAVIARLLARPQRFNLFQAISLIEQAFPQSTPIGQAHLPQDYEAVQLRSHVSLSFEASDIRSLKVNDGANSDFILETSVLGLAGAGGTLPLPFTEMLLERRARRDHAMGDFLDIFNHRFLAFLYRSRRKHHVALHASQALQAPLTAVLDSISSLGLREGEKGPDGSSLWLQHTGLLSGAPRSMMGLLALLRDRLDLTVHGTQFQGGWLNVDRTATACLGSHQPLGATAILGKRVWDQSAGIKLSFPDLAIARLEKLLPHAEDHKKVSWLVKRHLSQDIDVKLELHPAANAIYRNTLGGNRPMRLGWTSWLASPRFSGKLPPIQLKLVSHSA